MTKQITSEHTHIRCTFDSCAVKLKHPPGGIVYLKPDVARRLVLEGRAEYTETAPQAALVDPSEVAVVEPAENAMLPRAKPRRLGR